jgi:hypothetical protein
MPQQKALMGEKDGQTTMGRLRKSWIGIEIRVDGGRSSCVGSVIRRRKLAF